MFKKFLCIVCAIAVWVSVSVAVLAAGSEGAAWSKADGWAVDELERAQVYGLIPDCIKNQDFTKPITRREFAGVCVKLYELFTEKTAQAPSVNPFTDTTDVDALKAFNTDLMIGTAEDKFSPDRELNRQTAATALTRVLKKCFIDGWTYATDNQYTLLFDMPDLFNDDAKIAEDWAKPSVYFMAAKGVIRGKDDGMFAPLDVAKREEALIIALRMVEQLRGEQLAYEGGDSSGQDLNDGRPVMPSPPKLP